MTDHALRNRERFHRLSRRVSALAGRPATFFLAILAVLIWAAMGPWAGYSDTWQLVINTGTTVVTFLMVFLIQNAQNRDSEAIQVKLDEMLRATNGAHNALLDLEELEEAELEKIRKDYERLAAKARELLRAGKTDTGVEEVGT